MIHPSLIDIEHNSMSDWNDTCLISKGTDKTFQDVIISKLLHPSFMSPHNITWQFSIFHVNYFKRWVFE